MNTTDSHGKSVPEIFLMPIVVVVVGSLATFFVTRYQIRSTEVLKQFELQNSVNIASAQRDTAEKTARSELGLKALELFTRMITSKDQREREVAVRLLRVVDEELARKLALAIADDKSENAEVRQEARVLATEIRKGYWFSVVGTFKDRSNAFNFAKKIEKSTAYAPEIYLGEDNLYAVTLGGYLDREEANKRVGKARTSGIADDAYSRQSKTWSENPLTR